MYLSLHLTPFNDVFCTNKHRSLFNSTPTTLSRAVLIYEQSSLIHPKIHRATQARDTQMAAPPKPRKWETRRRLFSRRRRNKILSRSNFPGKSKFSGSNSFCTGSCPRFYVLANELLLAAGGDSTRVERVEVKGRGITLIVDLTPTPPLLARFPLGWNLFRIGGRTSLILRVDREMKIRHTLEHK